MVLVSGAGSTACGPAFTGLWEWRSQSNREPGGLWGDLTEAIIHSVGQVATLFFSLTETGQSDWINLGRGRFKKGANDINLPGKLTHYR